MSCQQPCRSLPSIPITATASGSLNPAYFQPTSSIAVDWRTRQIEEIRVLVKFVEHGTRSIFDLRSSKDSNAIPGELRRELRAALSVFKSCNSRSNCKK